MVVFPRAAGKNNALTNVATAIHHHDSIVSSNDPFARRKNHKQYALARTQYMLANTQFRTSLKDKIPPEHQP